MDTAPLLLLILWICEFLFVLVVLIVPTVNLSAIGDGDFSFALLHRIPSLAVGEKCVGDC